MKNISESDRKELFDALYFMKMAELKNLRLRLNLPSQGVKGELIDRIKHFINTGKILPIEKISANSRAKKGQSYPLMIVNGYG